jgi:hypothetical protein
MTATNAATGAEMLASAVPIAPSTGERAAPMADSPPNDATSPATPEITGARNPMIWTKTATNPATAAPTARSTVDSPGNC